MSEATTRRLIETYVAAFNAGDTEALLACLAEDVVHDVAGGGREIGREKYRWFLGMAARHYREELADVAVMVGEGGGRAAAECTVRGAYLSTAEGLPEASGQAYAVPAGLFFEVDDGRISRVTGYRNLAAWTAQLQEP